MSMIICEECGKEFSDKAPSCPNCGCPNQTIKTEVRKPVFKEDKKESGLSVAAAIFSIFIFTIGIGVILAIIDLIRNDKTKKHGGSWFALVLAIGVFVFSSIRSGNSSDDYDDYSEKSNEENYNYTIDVEEGSTFRIDNMSVSITNLDLNYTDFDDEYGFYDLEENMKYIKIGFEYLNKGTDDKYVSIYDYECYADGSSCEQTYYFGGDFINTNLGAGRKVSFEIFFVVPKDAKEIELETKPNMFDEEKIILKLQ